MLFLHGQPGSARDWDHVRRALGDRVTALAIDRPGWDGRSRATDLEGNARAAITALDRAGVQRAMLVGHSFGGGVAAWTAASEPERVAGLVLLAPSANSASLYLLDRLLARPVVGEVASAVTLGGAALALSAAVAARRLAGRGGGRLRYLRGAARRMLSPGAWESFTYEQRALVRDLPVLDARLGAISAPTTVVCGTFDRVVTPEAQRRLADQIPSARLEVIERAGHLLPLRHAERVAELILAASRPPAGPAGQPSLG